MALCTQADLEALRQIDVTAEPDPTVTALILHAEGLLEGLTGRQFEAVTDLDTDVIDIQEMDGVYYLSQYPISAIQVTHPDLGVLVDGTDYHLDSYGKLYRLGAGSGVYTWDWQYNVPPNPVPWPNGTVVRVSGGGDPTASNIPQDLRTLAAQVTAWLFDEGRLSAEVGLGVQSESVGGYSVSYSGGEIEDRIRDSKSKMQVVRRYQHQMPVVAF